MHQAQLGQLAHCVFKMVSLWGPKCRLVHKHRLRRHRFFDNIPLSSSFLIIFLLRETDPDRSFLLDLISFYFLRVTHYLGTKHKVRMDLFSHSLI